ncbi:MAG: hypothetical protein MJZ24_03820 [Paludibacteraceae bacterium]|nr:hypothetical protein [Paludibacteraceae bacterium]
MADIKCPSCGSPNVEQIDIDKYQCPYCGNTFSFRDSLNFPQQQQTQELKPKPLEDTPSYLMNGLCFCIPLVGIILYFIKKNEQPNCAKKYLTWSLIGIGLGVIISIIATIVAINFVTKDNYDVISTVISNEPVENKENNSLYPSSAQIKNNDSQNIIYKNGTRAIDMGLSVLWSDRNVGATSISDPGHLYSWGDSNWQDTDNKNKTIPSLDNISSSSYDIAKNELGDGWRMPTVDELIELKDNCSCLLKEDGPISYFELTSKINGNKIRIYLAGFSHFVSGEVKNVNKTGHIWSAEKLDKNNAKNLSIVKKGKIDISSYYAKGGISVRAVRSASAIHNGPY